MTIGKRRLARDYVPFRLTCITLRSCSSRFSSLRVVAAVAVVVVVFVKYYHPLIKES